MYIHNTAQHTPGVLDQGALDNDELYQLEVESTDIQQDRPLFRSIEMDLFASGLTAQHQKDISVGTQTLLQ